MQVKICGLKDHDMMQAALCAGADYVGLVFFEKSPRNVSIEQAASLADLARGRAYIVALVVDATTQELGQIVETVQPDYLQLHGNETVERADEIAGLFGIPVIKAIGVNSLGDVARADGYKTADIILFDAKADPKITQLPGGNGIAFDWHNLKGQKEQRNFMLSGGLTPENVQNAISLTGCAIVDVSSGVEISTGVKDKVLIQAFINGAKTPNKVKE